MRYPPWTAAIYELLTELQSLSLAVLLLLFMSIGGVVLSLLPDRNRHDVAARLANAPYRACENQL
jgi:hypothetical protein